MLQYKPMPSNSQRAFYLATNPAVAFQIPDGRYLPNDERTVPPFPEVRSHDGFTSITNLTGS